MKLEEYEENQDKKRHNLATIIYIAIFAVLALGLIHPLNQLSQTTNKYEALYNIVITVMIAEYTTRHLKKLINDIKQTTEYKERQQELEEEQEEDTEKEEGSE